MGTPIYQTIKTSAPGQWTRRVNQYSLPKLQEWEWGYIAGIVDGEGCLGLYQSKRDGAVTRFAIGQKDVNLLFWIRNKLNSGGVYQIKSTNQWTYNITNCPTKLAILLKILPYLIVKQTAAMIVIEYLKTKVEVIDGYSE